MAVIIITVGYPYIAISPYLALYPPDLAVCLISPDISGVGVECITGHPPHGLAPDLPPYAIWWLSGATPQFLYKALEGGLGNSLKGFSHDIISFKGGITSLKGANGSP